MSAPQSIASSSSVVMLVPDCARNLQFTLKIVRFIARQFRQRKAASIVQSIETSRAPHDTTRQPWRTPMDLLNTFFVFNLTATIAVLVGFFMMRDGIAVVVADVKAKASGFNVAGAAGAATSMVMLTSVAALFR
jgi:hypothetical protein